MAITQGDGGGVISLGGTAGSVCALTPSDQAQVVDNLIARIESLETAVMQLLTANIKANQLSDLSQQVGWIGGVEYMGQPGWTQTEYGSLIFPPGVSLSSLGFIPQDVGGSGPLTSVPQQLVIMDANGNLVFGAGTDGSLSGTFGGGSSISSYADVGWHNNTFSSILHGISIDSTSRSAGLGTVYLTGMAAGTYYAVANVTQYVDVGNGTPAAVINGQMSIGVPAYKTVWTDTNGTVSSDGFARETASISGLFEIGSPSQILALGWQTGIIGGSAIFENPYELALIVFGFS